MPLKVNVTVFVRLLGRRRTVNLTLLLSSRAISDVESLVGYLLVRLQPQKVLQAVRLGGLFRTGERQNPLHMNSYLWREGALLTALTTLAKRGHSGKKCCPRGGHPCLLLIVALGHCRIDRHVQLALLAVFHLERSLEEDALLRSGLEQSAVFGMERTICIPP